MTLPESRSPYLVLFGIRNRIRSNEKLRAKTILMGDCGPLIQILLSNRCD